ncbi:MAG TPA: amidase family protein, partial [Arenicellales bacterium]|nr:amidase family protein [Arenicellales bacterium]
MSSDDLSRLFATELSARLRSGALSPLEVMDATISRIEAVNPKVNALPTLCLGHAREQARAMTEQWASTDIKGPLWGLPLAVKDYNDLGGVATTYGSPLFADNIARKSDATVAKLQASGA